jgi:hypothetical protein
VHLRIMLDRFQSAPQFHEEALSERKKASILQDGFTILGNFEKEEFNYPEKRRSDRISR